MAERGVLPDIPERKELYLSDRQKRLYYMVHRENPEKEGEKMMDELMKLMIALWPFHIVTLMLVPLAILEKRWSK